ncbi:S-layer homology domain-containing protein [Paenibacillus sp. HWE-109]|uniref:S-layer homology domain-containing protein n=1 Tax=Paenibacillus sp. HWE-109 TaxID=1306526 RepID=UPI001EDE7D46|nr:S-layer homology domain-containing protein [Paenibacillus sp. HWE-109]UKS25681.1 S-layer homology domain-containing protein [Paenibacillus sp. HWE-109]
MFKRQVSKRFKLAVNKATLIFLLLSVIIGVLPPEGLVTAESVAPKSVVIEDFENNLSDDVLIQKRNFSGAMSLESDPKHVRSGNNSVRIDYDYIGVKENPSYVYVGPAAGAIPITGAPKKIGMWIYGNNDGHLIFSKFRDSAGKSFEVEYLDENVGVNWTGWKYIEGALPTNRPTPFTLEIYMRIEQSIFDKKNKGTVWVDNVRLIYEDDANEDMTVPKLDMQSPGNNAVLETNRPLIQLNATDDKSGIDPSSIQVDINGHPVNAAYDASSGNIQYQSATAMAGGYHTVHAAVYDRSGNPAEINSTFFIRDGVQYQLEAPNEVISNKSFQLKLQVKNADELKNSYAKLNYDPQTLEISSTEPKVTESLITRNEIDNARGEYQFELKGLSKSSIAADGTLVSLNIKVKPSAKMGRGELFKSIGMSDGSVQLTVGEAVYALAQPHSYTIGFPYVLTVKGSSLNTSSTIRVTDDVGVPVEGVSVILPNSLNPKSYVKVKAAESFLYANADASSTKISSALQAAQYFSSGVTSAGFTAVNLPNGKGTAWIPSADVELGLLTEKWGKTDANGEIRTNLTTLALLSLDLQAVNGDKVSKVLTLPIVPQIGADEPEYVRTYVTEDMKTKMSIVWRTAPRAGEGFIQYVKDSEFKDFEQSNILQQAAAPELLLAPDRTGEALFHKGLLQGLTPGTSYRYRVGYPGHWSAPQVFKTEAAKADSFSFLFVTDSHTNSEEALLIHQNLMQGAFSVFPDTRFVMHGGDIVDDGGIMSQWEQDMKASEKYSGSVPSAYTMGNHDVKNGGKQVFTSALGLPGNGMETQEHLTYSYDYEDTHFIVLNSEADEVDMKKQAAWLRENINASKKKWKVAMFHRPAYHTEDGRGPELVTYYLAPVLEELGVDLVLVGHDHALAWTYPMKNGLPLKDGSKGTIYLVGGSSGWKFYDAVKHDYLNYLYDDNLPVYSAISISNDRISIEARTTDGTKLQATTIEKARTQDPDSNLGTNPGTGTGPVVPVTPDPTVKPKPDEKPSAPIFADGVKSNQIKEAYGARLAQEKVNPTKLAFTDVSNLWSTKTITTFLKLKVIDGYPDGTFQPNGSITRGEFATIVSKAFGVVKSASTANQLSDVEQHWANEAIAALSSNGIISGYPDGTFKPDREISRAEIIAIISKIVNFNNAKKLNSGVAFTDTANSWNKEQIAKAAEAGLIQGIAANTFAPEQSATRAEALTVMFNAICLDPELKAIMDQLSGM